MSHLPQEGPKDHLHEQSFGVPIESCDLTKGFDSNNEMKLFMSFLRKKGLNPKSFMYSGFDFSKIDRLLKTGYHSAGHSEVYCSPYNLLISDPKDVESAYVYASTEDSPAMAVYDPKSLEYDAERSSYKIKPGKSVSDALKMVVKLKLPLS